MASRSFGTGSPLTSEVTRGAGLVSTITLAVVSMVGATAFMYPFLLSDAPKIAPGNARSGDAPLLFALLLTLALLMFVLELTRHGMNAKTVSLLAVIMMVAAALRIPTLPAGATGFFVFVIIGGYVFGARLGFLIGACALFVSAFAVGGFGPWLPFQLCAAGWAGMTAGWLGSALRKRLRQRRRMEVAVVALFAGVWGFLFGAIVNLWFWPFVAQGDSISWQPGMGLGETLHHYWSFYILTSAGWDAWRALGNVVLVLLAGRSIIDLLVRYRDRFQIRFE